MKNIFCWAIVLVYSVVGAQNAHFMHYPTLSPDASEIVFAYNNDLWKVSADGGVATRLTAMDGEETLPRISPDGQWLAFTAAPKGNYDIFVMPMAGGDIRQVTFHGASDRMESWSWDSETIYFTSTRENRYSGYAVSRDGGTPIRLFPHYFHTICNITPHPDGRLFFNETWEANYYVNRPGYKGAFNPDLKSYDPESNTYTEHTDFIGKDMLPTIDQNGKIYFMSTQANDLYNLFVLDAENPLQLTDFTTSVFYPQVSADGSAVVFEKDYRLHIYHTDARSSNPIDVIIPSYRTLDIEQNFDAGGNITAFAISPDNEKMAFVSRGELFVGDIKGKFVQQISTLPLGRVVELQWLSDNQTIVFNQTVSGYLNWFSHNVQEGNAASQLTNDLANNRSMTLNSDRSKGVYLSGRSEIRVMDLTTFESEVLVEDELWALFNNSPRFSPDDRYVLYSAMRNFEQDIFAIELASKDVINLTQTGLTETSGCWDPNAENIYFIANRERPSYPFGLAEPNLYKLPLQKVQKPFKKDKWMELFAEEEESEEDAEDEESDEKDDDDGNESDEEEQDEQKTNLVEIDDQNMLFRWENIGPTFGSQYLIDVVQKDESTILLYQSNHEGKMQLYQTIIKDFEDTETKGISGTSGLQQLDYVDGNAYALINGNIHTVDLGGGSVESIPISYNFPRTLTAEFRQMYEETWANVEENFYDEDFHGIDWMAIKTKYAAYLPYIQSRTDLRRILNDMLGELNTSHYGFYSFGKEESSFHSGSSVGTGIQFDQDSPYSVERIISNSPADNKDIHLEQGDQLIAVEGNAIDPDVNRESYFFFPKRPDELELTFQRADSTFDILLHTTTPGSISGLLYREWEENCEDHVDNQSDERIAYVHMRNMGRGELNRFLIDLTSDVHHKEALIVDLRYNTGGNVHDEVLRFLSQKKYLQWKYREGQLTGQSNFAPADKPMVLLINEQSLSDAEMTATGFKELGLGTIIGTETYRWIIFTSGKGLVDGSFYRLPSWGCYTLDGKNIEREGVAPDIHVRNTFADRLEGRDPQLDRAIDILLNELDP